ncbi:MAG TPA: type I methionyl aminopeptidase [Rubrobacter sp.]|nr:type I methionyl aminopeptidase [Rubrobacter sp.]
MTVGSDRDLAGLRRAGRVVALSLRAMREALEPGMTTAELDAIGAAVFERHGAQSAPRMVYGFPGVNLISINDEAVHGVPGGRVIEAGDLVKIDVTADVAGYVADAAVTVALPSGPPLHEELKDCAELAFARAASVARAGRQVNKIGRVVETAARRRGFAVLRGLSGHGVGRTIHEPPTIPNYFDERLELPLTEGLVITIEPIIAAGSDRTVEGQDGWTVRTADGSPAAHHEHTIVITKSSPVVLTAA